VNFLDFLFASTLIISVAVGAWRGWMPQALTLLGLLFTLIATIKFGPAIAPHLPLGGPGEAIRNELGALIAVVVTLYLGHKMVLLHRYLFPRNGTQTAHRTLGALFGVASGFVLLMVFALVIDATEYRDQPWWRGSYEERVAMALISGIKEVLAP
jgi:membrane protein required for colicin V production